MHAGLADGLGWHGRQVRLVVLDSVAFHFRADFEDMAARTRVLAQLAQALMRLAEAHDAAARPRWDQPPLLDPRKYIRSCPIAGAPVVLLTLLLRSSQPHTCSTVVFMSNLKPCASMISVRLYSGNQASNCNIPTQHACAYQPSGRGLSQNSKTTTEPLLLAIKPVRAL